MDGRKACELLIEALQLETNEYRLGNSKVRMYIICKKKALSNDKSEGHLLYQNM